MIDTGAQESVVLTGKKPCRLLTENQNYTTAVVFESQELAFWF